MKKLLLIIASVFFITAVDVQAQQVGNTYPATGNAIIGTGGYLNLQSENDGDVLLKFSNDRSWVFKQDGIGAGTSLVLQALHGNKQFKVQNYLGVDGFYIQDNGNSYFRGDMGIGASTTSFGKLQVNQSSDDSDKGIAVLNSTGQRAIRIWTDATNSYIYSGGTGTGNLILNTTGRVGIGTTAPEEELDVRGRIKIKDAAPVIEMHESESNAKWFFVSDGNQFNIRQGSTSGSNTKFAIAEDGSVGINTSITKGHTLAVKGDIIAEEVLVALYDDWPDYVFESNYELRDLLELDKYIQENKHLPAIPSAEEVKENGFSLGEMDAKLLEKVEELTLYVIQLKKELELSKERITELEKAK